MKQLLFNSRRRRHRVKLPWLVGDITLGFVLIMCERQSSSGTLPDAALEPTSLGTFDCARFSAWQSCFLGQQWGPAEGLRNSGSGFLLWTPWSTAPFKAPGPVLA